MSHTLKLAAKSYKTPNNSKAFKKVYANLKMRSNLYPDMFNNVSSLLLYFEMNTSSKWAESAFHAFVLTIVFQAADTFLQAQFISPMGFLIIENNVDSSVPVES